MLGKTAKLTFQLAHPSIFPEDLDEDSKAPPGFVKLQEDKNPDRFYMINKRVMVSGEMLKDASPTFDRNNSPSVSFQLSALGGKKFGRVTGKNIGRAFAIVLDGKVVSAPVIQTQIFSTGQITGSFTVQETNDLALVLRSGALPAPMVILEERSVGPGLGKDSISAGKIASIFGLIAVMVFMLLTYGMFGIFANIALVCNIIFIIALLSIIQATLTLPGIAGIVLTMGMAVDANVLIFERIKEEFNSGRNILDAIEAGFQRAISTIIDANLTTLFAALPSNFTDYAYENNSLPIGFEQTISQPYIVALMTEALSLKGNEVILEIGTGSGYQTSILSILSRRVYSIERIRPLLVNAISCFKKLKLTNITCECRDGFLGWPKLAPFDHLIVTCAVEKIDDRLLSQVRLNGTCVVPVGSILEGQRLKKITVKKNRENDIWEDLGQVNFVPLISDNY